MTLYQIEDAIMQCVDFETGEIIDEQMLEQLEMERDTKIENICLYIKNLKAEVEALKNEKAYFEKRMKTASNKVESLTNYLTKALGGQKFESTKVKVSYRKSDKVEVVDISKIPEEYIKVKEPEADKTAIKNALKSGVKVDGVVLVENSNIQIK